MVLKTLKDHSQKHILINIRNENSPFEQSSILRRLHACRFGEFETVVQTQGPVPERRNNSIPGINVPYFRDNFIPGINSVPERGNSAIQGINLG